MKKKVVMGLLAVLSIGLLAGVAEARPCNDWRRDRGDRWRAQRVAQMERHRYNQNRFWNRQRYAPPAIRRDAYRSAYYNNNRRWW